MLTPQAEPHAADARHNEVIHSLGTLLNGYVVIPVADKKAAAGKLLAIFNEYKGIASQRYANESSLIERFLEDFSAESLAGSIKALDGVSSYIADLRTAQVKFNEQS